MFRDLGNWLVRRATVTGVDLLVVMAKKATFCLMVEDEQSDLIEHHIIGEGSRESRDA